MNTVEMRNINKSFFGTRVLKDVNFSVRPGEVHALAGENEVIVTLVVVVVVVVVVGVVVVV